MKRKASTTGAARSGPLASVEQGWIDMGFHIHPGDAAQTSPATEKQLQASAHAWSDQRAGHPKLPPALLEFYGAQGTDGVLRVAYDRPINDPAAETVAFSRNPGENEMMAIAFLPIDRIEPIVPGSIEHMLSESAESGRCNGTITTHFSLNGGRGGFGDIVMSYSGLNPSITIAEATSQKHDPPKVNVVGLDGSVYPLCNSVEALLSLVTLTGGVPGWFTCFDPECGPSPDVTRWMALVCPERLRLARAEMAAIRGSPVPW